MEEGREAEHLRHVAAVKIRYDRGDMLFGPDAVGTLLTEITTLSERCLPPTGFSLWGGRVEEAYVSHHCGSTEQVDTLADAVRWATTHTCTTKET